MGKGFTRFITSFVSQSGAPYSALVLADAVSRGTWRFFEFSEEWIEAVSRAQKRTMVLNHEQGVYGLPLLP